MVCAVERNVFLPLEFFLAAEKKGPLSAPPPVCRSAPFPPAIPRSTRSLFFFVFPLSSCSACAAASAAAFERNPRRATRICDWMEKMERKGCGDVEKRKRKREGRDGE